LVVVRLSQLSFSGSTFSNFTSVEPEEFSSRFAGNRNGVLNSRMTGTGSFSLKSGGTGPVSLKKLMNHRLSSRP
jgi:hypothetical protein